MAGTPLYLRAVQAGLAAGLDHVIVSTDIEEVLAADHSPGVSAICRPRELCTDEASMDEVVRHATSMMSVESIVVLLQATSPLRRTADIRRALDIYSLGEHDLVMTVTVAESSVRKYGELTADGRFVPFGDPGDCFRNRQRLRSVYRPNGAVYVFGASWFQSNGGFATESIGAVVMSIEASVDIDDENDFLIAEQKLREGEADWT